MQMSTHWDGFLHLVLPWVPGCPPALAARAVHAAAAELCAKALVQRQDLAAVDVLAGQAEYDLNPPAGTVVAMVLGVRLDGSPLAAASEETLERMCPSWQGLTAERATHYLLGSASRLVLVPVPDRDTAQALVVRAALSPLPPGRDGDGAADIAQALLDQWADAVAAGARSRLLLMPGKEWSSAELGAVDDRRFRLGLQRARNALAKGRTRVSLSARPRTFGG
jgi:hypothetical protein